MIGARAGGRGLDMTYNGAPPTPAGWFPDPGVPGQSRWWDGQRWTEHVQLVPPVLPAQPFAGPPSEQPATAGNTFAGWGLGVGIGSVVLSAPWPLLTIVTSLVALVFGFLGLQRSNTVRRGRTIAVWGLSLAAIGLVLSIVALNVTSDEQGADAGSSRDVTPAATVDAPAAAPAETIAGQASTPDATIQASPEPVGSGIGQAVTNLRGVALTVHSATCGLTETDDEWLPETATGQFCAIEFSLYNGTNDPLSLSSSDFGGLIGEAEYGAEALRFGEDRYLADLNPGLTIDGKLYIDIPVDSTLEYVTYREFLSVTRQIKIDVRS